MLVSRALLWSLLLGSAGVFCAPPLAAESPGMRAFRLGEPVPLGRETPTRAIQVGVEAPSGLEWRPVGNGAWVAASVVLVKPDTLERGEFLNAYRPANDPKVAVLELIYEGVSMNSRATIMMGRRREVDGTERPVRMYRTDQKGLLAVEEPTPKGTIGKTAVLYRFAVGEPGKITLPLVDGRRLTLNSGNFALERSDRLRKLAARLDPAKGGPDWSAIDDDLVLFLALESGFESLVEVTIYSALEPLLEPLAADLAAESPAAAKFWREAVGRVLEPRAYAAAWRAALVAGGIADRGNFERLGRRGLRATPAPNAEAAEKLIVLWREADRTQDHERLLALRAQWRAGLKDKAALAGLDEAILPVLRREIARLRKEDNYPGTTAGLAFLAHQLGANGSPAPTTLGALKEPAAGDPEVNVARWYARVLLFNVWPSLAADHPESPRLVGFLNSHPDFAGNPVQAMLGLRPGAMKEFSESINRWPGRIPLALAGPMLLLPAKNAPPITWRMTFVNTDAATSTDPLTKQRHIVRNLRERPEWLYKQYRVYGGDQADAAREQLRDLARRRNALEYDQSAASGAAAKARQDWAAAQQRAWEKPALVMKPTDLDSRQVTVTRGLSSAEMASFATQHDSQASRAAALQGSVNEVRAQENAALAALTNAGKLQKELIADLKQTQIDLAREETVLARLEAAEARRIFHAGVGEHDAERLVALRRYVASEAADVVKQFREQPDSRARTRELQWWRWWLAIDRPDLGDLPAELRPAGYWMPAIAAEIVAEELHGALGAREISGTYKAAARAIDRAIQHVSPLQLSDVLGPPVRAFQSKLTAEEQRAFAASLDGRQQLVVTAALLKAASAKP